MFKQITVFIENKPGRLAEITAYLTDENINLHALSIADTTNFGILRMIVSDPDKAIRVLKKNNLIAQTTNVIAIAVGHKPGSLHKVLQKLEALNVSIEYMYAFTSRYKDYDAIVILRLTNQDIMVDKLKANGIPMLGQELLDSLNVA
jgi:hypothetical protein